MQEVYYPFTPTPKWQAVEGWSNTRRFLNSFLGVLNLLLNPFIRLLGHVGVGIGVIADLVTGIPHLTSNFRILLDEAPHHEEGGLHLVLI